MRSEHPESSLLTSSNLSPVKPSGNELGLISQRITTPKSFHLEDLAPGWLSGWGASLVLSRSRIPLTEDVRPLPRATLKAATRQTSQISPDIQKMTGTSARESLRSAQEKLLAAVHCTNPGSNLALVHLGEDAARNKQEVRVVAELSLQCPGYV
ncbi:Sterol 26-Hydroxylase [Manis pentadactyla]|nr:Sterol 26-Hydroxylase [Manis pentadactyla]